jgi:hypothetical protein
MNGQGSHGRIMSFAFLSKTTAKLPMIGKLTFAMPQISGNKDRRLGGGRERRRRDDGQ